MWMHEIETITKKRISYSKFLQTDRNAAFQREALLNLYNITKMYKKKCIQRNDNSDAVTFFKPIVLNQQKRDYRFKLQQLKIALLDDNPYTIDFPLENCCHNLTNYVFILAMLKAKVDIVYHFLNHGFPGSINSPIFGTDLSPTYFQLACTLNYNVLAMFLEYSPNYKLSWNGLTPQMIASFNSYSLYLKQPWDFVTTRQFTLLNKLRNVHIRYDREEPIFLLDFMCMNKHIIAIKKLIDKNPEIPKVSRFCYISHCNLNVLRVLTAYTTNIHQRYCGITPLHLSSVTNNISIIATFLYMKCNPNLQDFDGETPLHIAARKGNFLCLELLIRCGGNTKIKDNDGVSVQNIIDEKGWKMRKPSYNGTDVLPNIMDMHSDNNIFSNSQIILDHIIYNTNKVTNKKSRFKITSILNFSNMESDVENTIKKLYNCERYNLVEYKGMLSIDIFNSYIL